jgi:hypothetical protein
MQDVATWRAVSLTFRVCMLSGINSIVLGYIYLMMSADLNIRLLTISTANIWTLSGVELRNILIQLEFTFIGKNRYNISERTR